MGRRAAAEEGQEEELMEKLMENERVAVLVLVHVLVVLILMLSAQVPVLELASPEADCGYLLLLLLELV